MLPTPLLLLLGLMLTVVACDLAGNLFLAVVILCGIRLCQLHRTLNSVQLLILHTCIADILFALVTMSPTIVQFLSAPEFFGNDLICRLFGYARLVPLYASPFLLVAISADRYWAICHPLRNLAVGRRFRAHLLAALSWIVSLVLPIPNGLHHTLVRRTFKINDTQPQPRPNTAYFPLDVTTAMPDVTTIESQQVGRAYHLWNVTECSPIYPSVLLQRVYVGFFITAVWLLPTLMSAWFYAHVCRAVWNQLSGLKKAIAHQEIRKTSAERTGRRADGAPYVRERLSDACREQIRQLDRQKLDTIKLTLCIVLSHFLLWSPFCTVHLLCVFWPHAISDRLATYLMLLGNLNCCVNPWIFIFFQWPLVRKGLQVVGHRVIGQPITQIDPSVVPLIALNRATTIRRLSYQVQGQTAQQTQPGGTGSLRSNLNCSTTNLLSPRQMVALRKHQSTSCPNDLQNLNEQIRRKSNDSAISVDLGGGTMPQLIEQTHVTRCIAVIVAKPTRTRKYSKQSNLPKTSRSTSMHRPQSLQIIERIEEEVHDEHLHDDDGLSGCNTRNRTMLPPFRASYDSLQTSSSTLNMPTLV